jgi:glycosidase
VRIPFNFKSLNQDITLQVRTKSPEKWLLVDRETGQIYQGSENGHWDRLDPVIKYNDDSSVL